MASFFKRLLSGQSRTSTRSRHSRDKRAEKKFVFYESSRRIVFLILLLSFLATIFVTFWGQAPSGPRLAPDQVARTRVVADFPFEYESRILTDRAKEIRRKEIPPVYTVNYQHFTEFETFINSLNEKILRFSRANRSLPRETQVEKLEQELAEIITNSKFHPDVKSLLTLYRETDSQERYRLFQNGLNKLWNICQPGIVDPSIPWFASRGEFKVIQLETENNDLVEVRLQKVTDALLNLRRALGELDRSETIYQAMFEIMKEGVVPNLFYNEARHTRLIDESVSKVEPIKVSVAKGDTIIELGSIVSGRDLEKLSFYEQNRRALAKTDPVLGRYMQERVYYTFVATILGMVFVPLTYSRLNRRNRAHSLTALMLVINMIAIRLVNELGETRLFGENAAFATLLVYAPPFLLGPITVNLLIGAIPAILVSLFISTLYAMTQGGGIEVFLVVMVTCLSGILLSRGARMRTKIVKASIIAGLVLAMLSLAQGLFEGIGPSLLGQRVLLIIILSMVYGMLVVGIIPILESTFKIYSDISLLELTDYNHPLLRRMQMETPGTYHHSLMVANIAEKAAVELNANSLVCRTCSLFHDIGKLEKPQFFAENQTLGSTNPHDSMRPSMSALIIKNHVKIGVDIARAYSLPSIIIDVIRQHHGTSLIRYFYYQAIKEGKKQADSNNADATLIDQSNYRYDGPRPQFKESAIIFLSDSVEAASRSLKKVTHQSVEDLIDSLIDTAIKDGQLDECPLSFQEVAVLRASFVKSVLNVLHSRIEYPQDPNKAEQPKEGSTQSATVESAPATPSPEKILIDENDAGSAAASPTNAS